MTAIPYLDEMWSISTGCGDDMVSPGCQNCYARRMFGRNLWKCPECKGEGELITLLGDGVDCTACDGTGTQDFTPTFHADRLDQPLHWRKPRRVGVSFMGDLFHEAITDEQIDRVFSVMAMPQRAAHTFLILTKRAERMRDYMLGRQRAADEVDGLFPWPTVQLGVTVCNQAEADRNVPLLLDTPAAVRGISLEPMLGAVDLLMYMPPPGPPDPPGSVRREPFLDWVVLGGETGPGARPMQPEWALDVYRQCKAAGVPFWFKSMGTAPHKKVWDWTNTLGAEMQATNELPAVGQ